MRKILLVPLALCALLASASVAGQEPSPVPPCANPCEHCALTPRPAPGDSAQGGAQAGQQQSGPGGGPAAGADGSAQAAARTISATVVLPGGERFSALAPLPRDPQGFTWRMFRNRENPTPILGLHVYAPRQEAGLVTGTIRWSNGAVSPAGGGFCGAVYYDSFTLTAPSGWEWVTLPRAGQTTRGATWTVIPKPASGSHFARPREMLEWEFALVPVGDERARVRARAALRYEDLVIPDPFLNYGPTNTRLPRVDRRRYAQICRDWAARILAAQASGSKLYLPPLASVESEQIGAHWMDGSPAGYSHGGTGIDPTAAAPEQVPAAVLARALMHRANVARSFIACFNRDTGLPINLYEWTLPPHVSIMYGEPGRENEVELNPFLVGDYYTYRYPRFNSAPCQYENARTERSADGPTEALGLWDYDPHDVAHSIRAMRHAIALVEYARDPAARDFLLLVAETNRYGWFSDRRDESTPYNDPGQTWYHTTLTRTIEEIRLNPHQGGWFSRIFAWTSFSGACAIKYERDEAKRETWKAWGKRMLDVNLMAVDRFGFSGRDSLSGASQPDVRGIQTFHEMLVLCHRVTLALQVYGTVPREVVQANLKSLRSVLAGFEPRPYYGTVGPPHWIGAEASGTELAALSEQYAFGGGDPAHVWAACALTYRADPSSEEALNLALRHWHPQTSLEALSAFCANLVPDKNWSCEMESALEQRRAPK